MLVYGDADMIRPEHIVQFYQLLGGGLKDAGWQREHMSQNRLARRYTRASPGRSCTGIGAASDTVRSGSPVSLATVSLEMRIAPAGARMRLHQLPKPSR